MFVSDIVECDEGQSGPCEQICTNTIGGFECSCEEGFEVVSDTQCEGKIYGCSEVLFDALIND